MPTLTITVLEPELADPADLESALRAVYPTRVATWHEDQPHEPVETDAAFRASVRRGWSGDPRRLLVATDPEGEVLGHGVLELPTHDNTHIGSLQVHVPVEHRRQGFGRALAERAADLCRSLGRRRLLFEARENSPMAMFAAAIGAECKLVEVMRQQPIAEVDLRLVRRLREEAESAATGYRIERWAGETPTHLRAPMAMAVHSLNDAPIGDLDYEDERWDAERIALRDEFHVEARIRSYAMLAFFSDGEPAGYTEVGVIEDGTHAFQFGTGVAPAHRGHRLGMLLKTSMVEWLREVEPHLRTVMTGNAEVNSHMISINETLGYVVVERIAEWQLDL